MDSLGGLLSTVVEEKMEIEESILETTTTHQIANRWILLEFNVEFEYYTKIVLE